VITPPVSEQPFGNFFSWDDLGLPWTFAISYSSTPTPHLWFCIPYPLIKSHCSTKQTRNQDLRRNHVCTHHAWAFIFLRQNTSYQLILLDLDFSENPIPTKFPTQKFTNLPIQARNKRIISISLHSCMRKRLRANEFRTHQKYNTRSSSCVRNQRETFLPSFLSFLLKLVGSSRDDAQFFSKIYNSTSLWKFLNPKRHMQCMNE